jgi:hypothetical protein
MCTSLKTEYKITARTYKLGREQHSWVMSTVGHDGQFKLGRTSWNKGVPRTADVKKAISNANTGMKTGRTSDTFTSEWIEKISISNKGKLPWNKGILHSDHSKQLMSIQASQRKKKTCPHCNAETSPSNYTRWHGDNCRTKS